MTCQKKLIVQNDIESSFHILKNKTTFLHESLKHYLTHENKVKVCEKKYYKYRKVFFFMISSLWDIPLEGKNY